MSKKLNTAEHSAAGAAVPEKSAVPEKTVPAHKTTHVTRCGGSHVVPAAATQNLPNTLTEDEPPC